MYYYLMADQVLASLILRPEMQEIPETKAKDIPGIVRFLIDQPPDKFRRNFAASDSSLPFIEVEDINLLVKPDPIDHQLPPWFMKRISSGQVSVINLAHPTWQDALSLKIPDHWKVNIVGLGDVGGTLLTGLRLLGGGIVDEIGIYDQDQDKINRWDYEANQIFSPFYDRLYPNVRGIPLDQVFDCDLFVFCVSMGVPPLGQEGQDVRLAQFKGNARIVNLYAKMAREKGFKGIFAVMSDPVDLLCQSAFMASNIDELGKKDYLGLAPEQVRGYGLGVMNARATYFAKMDQSTKDYAMSGRAYGPHGEGLIIANSINNYDDELSRKLTDQARTANLTVRGFGYKPYVAPALSSGTLPLLATMEGKWHYSGTFMGGVFMGAKNRLTAAGTELERLALPRALIKRLMETYELLSE